MLNGRLYDDTAGHYTCFSNNGCSLVDYHIISSELFPFITRFRVEDKDQSDHFPVLSHLNFNCKRPATTNIPMPCDIILSDFVHYKWREHLKEGFFNTKFDEVIETLKNSLQSGVDKCSYNYSGVRRICCKYVCIYRGNVSKTIMSIRMVGFTV